MYLYSSLCLTSLFSKEWLKEDKKGSDTTEKFYLHALVEHQSEIADVEILERMEIDVKVIIR